MGFWVAAAPRITTAQVMIIFQALFGLDWVGLFFLILLRVPIVMLALLALDRLFPVMQHRCDPTLPSREG